MASLLSADEDSKANALKKLVDIYDGNSPDADREAAIKFSLQLSEMGYSRYLVRAARIHLKAKERKRAFQILEKGITQKYPPAFYVLGIQYLRLSNPARRAEGVALLERGRDLGSPSCAKKLAVLAAKDAL